jgi:hypothetical protein
MRKTIYASRGEGYMAAGLINPTVVRPTRRFSHQNIQHIREM